MRRSPRLHRKRRRMAPPLNGRVYQGGAVISNLEMATKGLLDWIRVGAPLCKVIKHALDIHHSSSFIYLHQTLPQPGVCSRFDRRTRSPSCYVRSHIHAHSATLTALSRIPSAAAPASRQRDVETERSSQAPGREVLMREVLTFECGLTFCGAADFPRRSGCRDLSVGDMVEEVMGILSYQCAGVRTPLL